MVEESYYQGDDYVDYVVETEADRRQILERMSQLNAQSPVLDIGCAQGHLLAEIDKTGRDGVGVDISSWAVAEATKRLGAGRAFVCDIDREPLPVEVLNRGPFGTIVIRATLEHFPDPFDVISRLSQHARPGCHLLILTSNVDGLGRFIFGPKDWEGHFDWTHRGVEKVGVRSLREELPKLGWRIEELVTHLFWNKNADPTCAVLRDCCQDARFRRLLEERGLGDLVTCIAVKE